MMNKAYVPDPDELNDIVLALINESIQETGTPDKSLRDPVWWYWANYSNGAASRERTIYD